VRVDLSHFKDVIFGLVPKIHDHRISQTFTRRPASSGAFGVHGSPAFRAPRCSRGWRPKKCVNAIVPW